jgi:predicted transcriptional regulator
MTKVLSTKLDAKVIRVLNEFCKKTHIKKSSIIEECILEGIREKEETLRLAESIRRGLKDEQKGNYYTLEEVERHVFGRKRKK